MFFEDEEFTNKKPEGSLYIENIDNDDWYINDGVLEECRKSDAEEMEIPEGVTSINTYAIMDNYSVKSIHLPKTVKRLESTGIAECGNLTKVVIDNPDIEIMEWGLSYNEALKEVYIGGKKVDSIVAKRYSDGAKCFERYLGEGEEITVEEGVRQINNNAFENCKTLTKIILPDTVDTICDNAFNECENLRELTLGDNVRKIGENAFNNCIRVNELRLPQSVEEIGKYAFYGWDTNQTIYVPSKFQSKGLFKKLFKEKWQAGCSANIVFY